ncbi:MAG: hypothetical protein LBL58_12950 [Tannerellaceae bacterium]|jgi:hypothetical protein|nr:hypothetical protein [Tannerellaceae bacterium]
MKTVTLLMTMFVMWTAVVYGEDAAVLPAKTLRFGAGTAIDFVHEAWDGDGKKVNMPDAMIIGTRIGIAYGFTDWFSTVFDWSPGLTDTDLTSIDIGNDGNSAEEIYEGLGDFTLKGQFQIIGKNGPVSSERFRMRITPGMVIPFPGIDDKDALGNHTWGMGGDVSFDMLITDTFFFNMFSEVYVFPFKNHSKTNHTGEFSLEAGPHYALTIGTANLAFALPINWSAAEENNENMLIDGISSHVLSLRPSLALQLTWPFRINIEIEYAFPLYGKNNYIAHTITIKAPVNFNFAKNKENNEGEQR